MKKVLQHCKIMLLLAFCSTVVSAQDMTITGKVNESGAGELYGVNIVVKGTTRGTTTNNKGEYSIVANKGTTLTYSYIGYQPKDVTVGNSNVINVELIPDDNLLGEVVVTAFGMEKEKKALGYSVTQIGGDQLTESRTINVGNALTGKIAGVNVSSPTTGAAGTSRVVIRGGSSLGGNDQPLYVINGVPMDNSNQGSAGMWGGNDNGDGLSSINPDDIATISVLKGNTASALYGSRAANGVILITTKTGKGVKGLGVSFNSNYTANRAIDLTDLQQQYGTGTMGVKPTTQVEALENGNSSWGAKLDGSPVIQFDGETRPYSATGEGLNDFYRTGSTWTNTLALAGSNELGSFRFSASDLRNQDILPNSGFDRTTFNGSMNGKFGKLELIATGQYTSESAKNRPRLSDSPGNANYTVITKAPNISFTDMRGTTDKLGANDDGTERRYQSNVYATNPYWAAYQFLRLDSKNRFFGNASLKYNITDWLYVQGRIGTDYISGRFESSEPYGTAYKTTGDYNITNRTTKENNLDLFIGANKTFGKFSADILLGGNRMRRSTEDARIGGNGLNIPFFGSVNNVANQTYGYGLSEYGINSIFGSANIGFNNYLFLNVTARQDHFSTLSRGNNEVTYPSAGLSFVFSEAIQGMPNWLTFGKVRASWAQVGGGAPDPYSNNLTYGLRGYQHDGAILGAINNGSIPNANLKPYISTETEIGFDLRFFQNRLGLDLALYNRNTNDDILNTSISGTSGYGSTQINIGELTNKGIEILLKGTPIKKTDFTWDMTLNFARNISNVVSLGTNAAGDPIEFLNLDEARSRQERIRHYVGQQLGVIAGYKQKEIDGQKVYDKDGFPVRGDFQQIALGRHPISAGFSNSFTYKGFNLSFLIDLRQGGSMMSGTNLGLYGVGLHKGTLPGRDAPLTVSGVTETGEANTWTIERDKLQNYYNYYTQITENFVYNSSFGKLRELSVGYSIPARWLDKTPISTLKFSAVGRNLLLLWSSVPNVDPESGYTASGNSQGLEYFALPTTRNLGFNLSATF
ncbi:SusC/RagA family TonB-linked outer membrane protein [Persicitalea jodogahamensis]|uniref:SusC/RagA family TonB-linked outer membrane protein n=1 Tax=Persicitalea jodogahamensis TaxID=402147 RepID=A0A8J3D7K5_9BACT|nr:SusC/RagA family TonB-linked outer membrane protein [Persicitalea jodogahamensis]GHB85860.1 SusC/RagA family TonB-linked outer membrane protein [Persicitalea jodogahamensis]